MTRGVGPVPEEAITGALGPVAGDAVVQFLTQLRLRVISDLTARVASSSSAETAAPGETPTPGPPGPPGAPAPSYVVDVTPPPTPSGVVVTAGLDFVFVQTDAPSFSMGNGYGRTVVYAANHGGSGPLPTFGNAVRIHEFVGQIGNYGSEPATQWHVWVKWRTRDGVESVSPAGGTNGFQVTTGQSVALLLQALAGSITQSELNAALSAKITTSETRLNRVVNYRIAAQGSDATLAGYGDAGLFNESGAQISGVGRGYTLNVLDGTTGLPLTGNTYDTYASPANAAALASALNALGPDKVVVVRTFDEPQANRLTGGLPAALKRCGASQVVIDRIKYRGAYILVGIPGIGEGGGVERIAGDVDSSPSAWCEYALQLVNGRPVALGGSPTSVAVQQEITTRIAETGHLSSLYTVRAQLTDGGRTIMGGFGLSGTTGSTAGPTIDFGVLANRFYIGAPAGSTGVGDVQPFVVQTTDTTVNGVAIPKGVYMDAAFINNVQAVTARLGTLWVTDAMVVNLSASKITAGSLAVGEYIQSSAFTPGGTGFRIDGGGGVEIRNAGGTRAFNLGASGTQPIIKVGSALEILANGTATFSGALSAATGSFSGSIIGGTITGSDFRTAALGKRITINEGASNEAKFYGDRGDGTVELLASIGISNVSGDFEIGAFGSAQSARVGIYSESSTATAVLGLSGSNAGVFGRSTSSHGVLGNSTSGDGVFGVTLSASKAGVRGSNADGKGVYGSSIYSSGVYGDSSFGVGVKGVSTVAGVEGTGQGTSGAAGVKGSSSDGPGGLFVGNNTVAPLLLTPYSNTGFTPSSVEAGQLAFIKVFLFGSGSLIRLCYSDGTNWRRVEDNTIV